MHLSASLGSKNLKKRVQNGPKLKHETGTQKGHSALLECQLAQIRAWPKGTWIELKLILFNLLEIRTCPSSYSNHFN